MQHWEKIWQRALSSPAGRAYYRSLRELGTELPPEPEFSPHAERSPEGELHRRELLALLGASLGLAGLSGCNQNPREKILPYVRTPPELTPGRPLTYATSMVRGGFAVGLLGQVYQGRPVKLEGNPDHPESLGSTGIYEQAAVLDLYDPARLAQLTHAGAPADWEQAFSALAKLGPRSWFVLPPQSSPLVGQLLERIRERLPNARVTFHSGLPRHAVYDGTRRAFGRALEPRYSFARADVVLALDADFLSSMPGWLRMAREFAQRRRLDHPSDSMARLYVAEAMPSPAGSLADHHLPLPASQVHALLRAILQQLPEAGAELPSLRGVPPLGDEHLPQTLRQFSRAVAADLAAARGRSVIIVGERQPPEVHVLAHALNDALGNIGRTVSFIEPALLDPDGGDPLTELATALKNREVDALVILDENLAYTAPPELELRELIGRAASSFCLSYHDDETTRLCQWRLPLAHFLESWGDARAHDGTLSYVQPLIAPLLPARSVAEVLAACAGQKGTSGHQLLRELYRGELGDDFEQEWERRLAAGVVPGSAASPEPVSLRNGAVQSAWSDPTSRPAEGRWELNLIEGKLYDGRYASNAWLQELPQPATKQTWGNAAIVSPRTARKLKLTDGRVVALSRSGRTIAIPALVLPGHADGVVSVALGYGSEIEGLGRDVGADAYLLRSAEPRIATDLRLHVTPDHVELALTQEHFRLHGRETARSATLEELRRSPNIAPEQKRPQPSLLPVVLDRPAPQWAMTIDTMICSGCSACVVACQAENNIPVVGKQGVMRSREMHWIRIDRYYEGSPEEPKVLNQPMLCQHCEKAPCEYVCPVNATVHSPDGLNEMVYNRCIGTRFCSNNCPYKVRRFNWLAYTDHPTRLELQRNPDVTVRERGVMEKCTYCVQRIRRAERQARIEHRAIRPGEVVTACQAACPTQAIQFGSLHHRDTEVVRWREQGRSYAVLHDLGTQPRTRYLAKIENPNPKLRG